jgi:hypothetical protein
VAEELLIRDSTPADLSALEEIFRRAALTNEGDREWISAHPEQFGIDEANVIEGRARVAVVEGRVVGFATLVGNELEDLFDRIEVTANKHAQAFYEAAGFVHDGLTQTPGGPAHRMHLDC